MAHNICCIRCSVSATLYLWNNLGIKLRTHKTMYDNWWIAKNFTWKGALALVLEFCVVTSLIWCDVKEYKSYQIISNGRVELWRHDTVSFSRYLTQHKTCEQIFLTKEQLMYRWFSKGVVLLQVHILGIASIIK